MPRKWVQGRVPPNFSSERGNFSDLLLLKRFPDNLFFAHGDFRIPPHELDKRNSSRENKLSIKTLINLRNYFQ